MNTRYHEMIHWSLINGIFSIVIIGIYYKLNKKRSGYKQYNTKRNMCLSDVMVLMILISITAIRCNCGSDYYNYYSMYNFSVYWYQSLTDVIISRFQNGFMALSFIVKSIFGGEFTIFAVVAFIEYIPMIVIIRKRLNHQTEAFALWILLGFFSLTLNILKQSIAMVFLLLAYDCLQKKRYIRYLLCSWGACFFHISSIFVVVILVIAQVRVNIKRLYRVLMVVGITAALFISKLLPAVKMMLPAQYQHYVDYFLSEEISKDYKLQLGALIVTVVFLILLRQLVYKVNELDKKNRYCVNMVKIMVYTEPVLIMGIRFFLLNRVAYEAFQFLPLAFSEYIHINRKKEHIWFWTLMLMFCMAISILCGENNYYNYSTIFNDNPCSVKQFVSR